MNFSLLTQLLLLCVFIYHDLIYYVLIFHLTPLPQVPMVIVGNKADMRDQRTVSASEAEALARANKAEYIEASARAGDNVAETFEKLVRAWGVGNQPSGAPAKKRTGGGCTLL